MEYSSEQTIEMFCSLWQRFLFKNYRPNRKPQKPFQGTRTFWNQIISVYCRTSARITHPLPPLKTTSGINGNTQGLLETALTLMLALLQRRYHNKAKTSIVVLIYSLKNTPGAGKTKKEHRITFSKLIKWAVFMYLNFSYYNKIVAKHQKLENQSFGITTLGTLRRYKTLYSLMGQIFFTSAQPEPVGVR